MASTAASRPRLAASLLDEGISPLSRCRAAPASSSKSIGFAFQTDGKAAKMPGVENILRHAPPPLARGRVHARRPHGLEWRTGIGSKGSQAPAPRRPPSTEEHTSELQSLMRSSYAVVCLKN